MPRCDGRVIGVFGIDQRQGDEMPAVLGPGFEQGRRARSGGDCTHSPTGPLPTVFNPTLSAAGIRFLCGQSLRGASEGRSWASCTSCWINCSGLGPKARSTRRAVPKRLVTAGKSAPSTRVKSRAGPAAARTRRWISAISSSEETGASTGDEFAFARRQSRNWRRLCMVA